MDYLELSINVTPKELGSDILIAELSELGFDSFVDADNGFNAYILKELFVKGNLVQLFSQYADELKIEYAENEIPQQNWNKQWECNFEPIDISGQCYIRAPFHEPKSNYKYDIVIEPKMSFGTGHHQTTQLMVQKLLQLDLKYKSLLDLGCGTGILAIAASKMGANPITAVDIDEWSYENSIENVQKNNINNISVLKGGVEIVSGKTFFTILANINKNVLLNGMSEYVASLEKQGNLLLSGFFETDIKELESKALQLGLKLNEAITDDGWALLHFVNNS
jgi:ribosomal protein L11 methyltransferase